MSKISSCVLVGSMLLLPYGDSARNLGTSSTEEPKPDRPQGSTFLVASPDSQAYVLHIERVDKSTYLLIAPEGSKVMRVEEVE